MEICFVLAIIVIGIIAFYKTNKVPLNDNQIYELSKKRRDKYIAAYYSPHPSNTVALKSFKSNLDPNGRYYTGFDMNTVDFHAFVASLLSYKKHEWVVIAVEGDGKIKGFWANKGPNNTKVWFTCSIDFLINKCKESNGTTLMRYHNHPNSSQYYQLYLLPSAQDKYSAAFCAEKVNSNNINWIEYIYTRGHINNYYSSFCEAFYPGNSDESYIQAENQNPDNWYRLNRELKRK